jgi:Bax protein
MRITRLFFGALTISLLLTSCGGDSKPPAESTQRSSTDETSSVAGDAETGTTYSLDYIPEDMTVPEKKHRFNALVLPVIEEVYAELTTLYKEVGRMIDDGSDSLRLAILRKKYRVPGNAALLQAVKPHPVSIALAQAAMESGWGTSRLFQAANNLFGVWSVNPDEPRIAAAEKRGDRTIWMRKYSSLNEAVGDYYLILARSQAFREFRLLRMQTNDPFRLVTRLENYSEKGSAYGEELAAMIRYNKFDQYD